MATVLTGSMEPNIDKGDVVLMKSLGGRTPRVGEVVLVRVPERFQQRFHYPSRIIHRVQRVEGGLVTTKGDNLEDADPFRVRTSAIDQRVLTVVPGGGPVFAFLHSPFALVWLGIGVLLFLVLPALDTQRQNVRLQRSTMSAVRRLSADLKISPRPGAGTDGDLHEVVGELVDAVVDYGDHLRRNREAVRSMAMASRELAAVVSELREVVGRLRDASPEAPVVDLSA